MNTPKYYRLLEKGEIIQEGDYFITSMGELSTMVSNGGIAGTAGHDYQYLRPVICDEWIEYAKQKPTKEDNDPTNGVQVLYGNGDGLFASHSFHVSCPSATKYWRRVTLPEPPKPKSATVSLKDPNGHTVQSNLTLLQDGTAKLQCGDVISAESIDEFIKAREGVMKK